MAKNNFYAALHWLGSIKQIGTKKSIEKFCRDNSYNSEHPIYIAVPLGKIDLITCDKCGGAGVCVIPSEAQSNKR